MEYRLQVQLNGDVGVGIDTTITAASHAEAVEYAKAYAIPLGVGFATWACLSDQSGRVHYQKGEQAR